MRSGKNYSGYRFSLLIGNDTEIQEFTFFTVLELSRSRSVVSNAHTPRIHLLTALTLSRSRSVARRAHFQAFARQLAHVLDSLVRTATEKGLWARPPMLAPVPSQAIPSRACLNSRHSDIQDTPQKSQCVKTFLRPSKKKQGLSLSGCLGLVVGTWKHGCGPGHAGRPTHETTERR